MSNIENAVPTGLEGIEEAESLTPELWKPVPGEERWIIWTNFETQEGDEGLYIVGHGYDIATSEAVCVIVGGHLAWVFNRHGIDVGLGTRLTFVDEKRLSGKKMVKEWKASKLIIPSDHGIFKSPWPAEPTSFSSCYELYQATKVQQEDIPPKTRRKTADKPTNHVNHKMSGGESGSGGVDPITDKELKAAGEMDDEGRPISKNPDALEEAIRDQKTTDAKSKKKPTSGLKKK